MARFTAITYFWIAIVLQNWICVREQWKAIIQEDIYLLSDK